MKKILLIMPISTLDLGTESSGGVDTVCQNLLGDLVRKNLLNYKIRVLAFDPKSNARNVEKHRIIKLSANIDLVWVDSNESIFGVRVPGFITNLHRVRQQVMEFNPDIIHSHQTSWLIGIRGNTIATLHTYKYTCRKPVSLLNDFFYAQLIPRLAECFVKRYTCVGRMLKDVVELDSKRSVFLIENPINPLFFNGQVRRTQNTKIKFVTCSLITRRKRIKEAILFIHNLRMHGLDVELTIIGPCVEYKYYDELVDYVRDVKLEDKIIFLGYKNTSEIVEIYKNSDLGIFLSREETFGLAPLEMLATGLPVICSDVGVIKEHRGFFEDIGVYIFDPSGGCKITQPVLDFIHNTKEVDSDMIKATYSASAINDHYFSLYDSVIK